MRLPGTPPSGHPGPMTVDGEAAPPNPTGDAELNRDRARLLQRPTHRDSDAGDSLWPEWPPPRTAPPRGCRTPVESSVPVAYQVGDGYRGSSGIFTTEPVTGVADSVVAADGTEVVSTSFRTKGSAESWINHQVLVDMRRADLVVPVTRPVDSPPTNGVTTLPASTRKPGWPTPSSGLRHESRRPGCRPGSRVPSCVLTARAHAAAEI